MQESRGATAASSHSVMLSAWTRKSVSQGVTVPLRPRLKGRGHGHAATETCGRDVTHIVGTGSLINLSVFRSSATSAAGLNINFRGALKLLNRLTFAQCTGTHEGCYHGKTTHLYTGSKCHGRPLISVTAAVLSAKRPLKPAMQVICSNREK